MGNGVSAAENKLNASANLIQSFWRGQSARKKFAIPQLSETELKTSKTFLVGNDPIIKDLELYASEPGKTMALIGTSGLRSLAIACSLGNRNSIPKLIIVDNSREVIAFWRNLRTMLETNTFYNTLELLQAFLEFIDQNQGLCHLVAPDCWSRRNSDSVEYENQDPVLYLYQLISTYGLDYVSRIITKGTFIAQSWGDRTTFTALKNILSFNEIDVTYLYLSNIPYCGKIKESILTNIQQIAPILSIITDRCPTDKIPKQVFLTTETHPSRLEQLLFPPRYLEPIAESESVSSCSLGS